MKVTQMNLTEKHVQKVNSTLGAPFLCSSLYLVIRQLYEKIDENTNLPTKKIKDDSLDWIQVDESEFVSNLQKKYSWTDTKVDIFLSVV